MELINEINQIKKIMGLTHLNEASGGWLDDLFRATKSLLTKTIKDKNSLSYFINEGLDKVPALKTAIAKTPALGTSLKSQLKLTRDKLLPTDPNFVLIDARIKEIDDLLTTSKGKLKKIIKSTVDSLETSYPNLFKKRWYGSYVNDARIKSIKKQAFTEFKGKSTKDIQTIIESKLSKAESTLEKIKMTNKRKSAYRKIIKDYRNYMKKNPIKGTVTTAASVPVISTFVYLLYSFFENWYDLGGSPIPAAMKTVSGIWGQIKTGWNASKSYPAGAMGLLSYLNEKYGNKNWKNDFRLDINGNSYIITHLSSGESKSFQYKGNTYIEQ